MNGTSVGKIQELSADNDSGDDSGDNECEFEYTEEHQRLCSILKNQVRIPGLSCVTKKVLSHPYLRKPVDASYTKEIFE